MTNEFFWEKQKKLLEEIRKSASPTEEVETFKISKRRFYDYPPVWKESSLIQDWDKSSEQEAEVGETFAVIVRNRKAVISRGSELEGYFSEILEENENELVVSITSGIEIWEVIQPYKLERMPDGRWETARWKPRVWNEKLKKWIPASPLDCKNWYKIPSSKKRVNYCLYIIPDW